MDPIDFTIDGGATFSAIGSTRRIPVDIFKLGSYPDKGFTCDTAKAESAIARHVDAPILVNHRLSVFNQPDLFGIGKVVEPYLDGEWIKGFAEVTDAAAALLKGKRPPVSAGWTRDGRIGEVSLVLDPRIVGAAVAHAFGIDEEPVQKPPVIEERRGQPMSIIAAIKEKLGLSDTQVTELRAEFSNSAEVEGLKTRLAAAETKTTSLETENASLKTQVQQIGTGVGASFAKSQAQALADKYLADRKIGKDEVAETVAAFEAAFGTATFGAEEPAAVKILKAMFDKRAAQADPTEARFSVEDPNGRQSSEQKPAPFDAVANFNGTGAR